MELMAYIFGFAAASLVGLAVMSGGAVIAPDIEFGEVPLRTRRKESR